MSEPSAVDAAEAPPGPAADGRGAVPPIDHPAHGWQRPVLVALAVLLVMWIVQALTIRYWGAKPESVPPIRFPGEDWLGGLFRFDGGWYSGIARDGYSYTEGQQSNVAFFPAYPLAQRLLTPLFGDVVLAGIAIATACGLASVAAFWTWLGQMGLDRAERWTSVLVALLYPYGVFRYGVVYSDAMFVLACLGTFLLAQRRLWWWAGVVGIVATAGRPTGIAVPVGLLVLALEHGGVLTVPEGDGLLARWRVPVRVDLSRLRAWQLLPPVIAAGGFLAYAGYLWERWGDPLLFSTVQKYWDQPSGIDTILKEDYVHYLTNTDYVGILTRPQTGLILGTRTLQGLILLAVLVAVPFIGRRFGWGYAAFVLTIGAIAVVGTKDFHGSGRYMLATFPVFALLGRWLAGRPALARTWIAVSGLAAIAMMSFYAHGVYLT